MKFLESLFEGGGGGGSATDQNELVSVDGCVCENGMSRCGVFNLFLPQSLLRSYSVSGYNLLLSILLINTERVSFERKSN